jgi:hypothetical protein
VLCEPAALIKFAKLLCLIGGSALGIALLYLSITGNESQGPVQLLTIGCVAVAVVLIKVGIVRAPSESPELFKKPRGSDFVRVILFFVGGIVWAGLGALGVKFEFVSDTELNAYLIMIPAVVSEIAAGVLFVKSLV